jgi:hypothetical protein
MKGGQRFGAGRKEGVRNKFTLAAKQMFEMVHQDIGGREAMAEWARKNDENRREFYKMYCRLIPVDLRAQVEHTVTRLSYAERRASAAAGAEAPGLAPTSPIH